MTERCGQNAISVRRNVKVLSAMKIAGQSFARD